MTDRERPLPNDWWPRDATDIALAEAARHTRSRPLVITPEIEQQVEALARAYGRGKKDHPTWL